MQSLAAGCLAERLEPKLFQTLLQFFRGLDDGFEFDVRRRIKIEHEPARNRRMAGSVVPGMILDGRDLRRRNQALNTVDLSIRLAVSFHGHETDQVRHAAHRVPLEKSLRIDAVRSANEGARPTFEMLDHPRTDLFEIMRQIDF